MDDLQKKMIKIGDLQDAQRKASGTKVILDIPIHLIPYEKG